MCEDTGIPSPGYLGLAARLAASEARCAELQAELYDSKRANGDMSLVWARGEDARIAAESERDAARERERLARVVAMDVQAERDRLRRCLDAVEGAATGAPGVDPETGAEGWSTALAAVRGLHGERDRLRLTVEREVVFYEEEAACGATFYEATFRQRATALRAALGGAS